MESYEEFCSRSLARLQTERDVVCLKSFQRGALSTIQFHGRHLLLPLLSEQQRVEMSKLGQTAAQRDADRQCLRRSTLLARVQDILNNVQAQIETGQQANLSTCVSPNLKSTNSFSPLLDKTSVPWTTEDASRHSSLQKETLQLLNRHLGRMGLSREESMEEDSLSTSLSLTSQLKMSQECMEREQGRPATQSPCADISEWGESLSDTENDTSRAGVELRVEEGYSPAGLAQHRRSASPGSLLGSLSHSLMGSYARLPSPEPSRSPPPRRSRPRAPVANGNILISCPVSACELSPGRTPGEGRPSQVWDVARGRLGGPPEERASPLAADGGRWNRSYSAVGGRKTSTPRPAPCLHSPPAPNNTSYDVESPSPALLRTHVASEPSPSSIKRRLDMTDPRKSTRDARLTLEQLATLPGTVETQHSIAEEVQRQIQALEAMRRRLEEEHASQLTQLIAEQEKEQQRLHQELQRKEERLRGQGLRPGSTDDVGTRGAICPSLSTACPAARSPPHSGHRPGLPYLLGSSPLISTVRTKLYTTKPKSRHTQLVCPELQLASCRLGAAAKGFLTRRLLNTEKIRLLRKTVQDTKEFIRSFQTDTPQKTGSISTQDLTLQERVRAQLRAALLDVHEVFFVMPVGERVTLLQQDRELGNERRLRDAEKAKSPRDKMTLSAATQKSLDRRKLKINDASRQGKKMTPKAKSPFTCTNRILQPNQGQNAAVPGQPPRPGSLSAKKAERVKKSAVSRKQLSLA